MILCVHAHNIVYCHPSPSNSQHEPTLHEQCHCTCGTTTHSWPLTTMNNIKAPYKVLYFGRQNSCMSPLHTCTHTLTYSLTLSHIHTHTHTHTRTHTHMHTTISPRSSMTRRYSLLHQNLQTLTALVKEKSDDIIMLCYHSNHTLGPHNNIPASLIPSVIFTLNFALLYTPIIITLSMHQTDSTLILHNVMLLLLL